MPFDGKDYKPTIKPLQTGLSGLKQLGDALRFIPQDHKWNFSDAGGPDEQGCGSHGCAIGVARCLWPENNLALSRWIADFFKLPREELAPIFGVLGGGRHRDTYPDTPYSDVTPHDVADAIDDYIATHREAAEVGP